MLRNQMKYKIRRGTNNPGKDYEYNIAALLSLRCARAEEDAWIALNAAGVGAFDDIILHQGTKTFMLQLKHSGTSRGLSKTSLLSQSGKFSLDEYVQDIVKLRNCIELKDKGSIIQFLDNFENIYFVLFTNRAFGDDKFLKPIDDDTFVTLNTATTVYKVDGENYPSNMYLFPNQIHDDSVITKIAEEIQQLAKYFGIKQFHDNHHAVKEITEKFRNYVKAWSEGRLGGHYCLMKHDIICKLTELFCCYYETKLVPEKIPSCKYERHVWDEIVRKHEIVLVDHDEVVVEFLLEYVGSEVRKYCAQSNYWNESFSQTAQTEFYQKHDGLKIQMLKVVGKHGKITSSDVYKCLWMDRQLPLLLEINNLDQYHDILNILKLSHYYYKAVIINKCDKPLPPEDTAKLFRTANDLDQETRREILKQEVKLQGRSSVTLEKLVDEEMLHHISCKDIITILMGRFSIGNNLHPLPQYFIPRSVSMVLLKPKVLDEITDETFLIEETSEKRFTILNTNNSNVRRLKDVNTNTLQEPQIILTSRKVCYEEFAFMKTPLHHLAVYNEEYLEWKASYGSVENLRPFQVELSDVVENNIQNKFYSSINIISGVPGMGKSVLMDYVASQAPADKWVVRVDLNEHLNYYKSDTCRASTTKASHHLEQFKINTDSQICNAVFEKLCRSKDIMVLLDGFDEVPISYIKEVTNIAKCLLGEGYKVWLTTRPHMNSHLEKQLETFSVALKSFTVENQKEFLTNYFPTDNAEMQLNFNAFIQKFVEKLKAAENGLSNDAKFMGIPLQTKLLADQFAENSSRYGSGADNNNVNESFDLVSLYRNFINRKIDILRAKHGSVAEEEFVIRKDHVVYFAIKLLFPKHQNKFTYINEELVGYKSRPQKLKLLQMGGIITIDRDFEVNFTHRTFAEFLVAEWLSTNSNNSKLGGIAQVLAKERFTGNYTFLFNVYDLIVSKNCPLRLAIVNRDINKALRIINSQPNVIVEFDSDNRSILHIIALHSVTFPLMNRWLWNGSPAKEFLSFQTFNSDINLQIIEKIPKRLMNFGRDTSGYTPLDYALANRSFTIADRISTISYPSRIHVNVPLKYKTDYLAYCVWLNYRFLFYDLLTYFASRELLLNEVQPNETLGKYFSSIFKYHDYVNEISTYKFEGQSQTVSQLLQSQYGQQYSGWSNEHYTDISYAVSFGTLENLDKLELEVNRQDHNASTPLHYAALRGQSRIVKQLILQDSDVNKQNINKDTPLHLAIKSIPSIGAKWKVLLSKFHENPKEKIIRMLARRESADVNLRNKHGCTPLHLAVAENTENSENAEDTITWTTSGNVRKYFSALHICNINSVRLLLLNGADVNVADLEERTVLHYAARTGCVEILTEILSIGVKNIDALTCHNETPLFYAVGSNKIDSVKLLIDKGANVNVLNGDNCSVLHHAARYGYNDIVSELLIRGARIDELDCNGETPLFLAVRLGKTGTVVLLTSKAANTKIVNNNGETVLKVARRKKVSSIIELLS